MPRRRRSTRDSDSASSSESSSRSLRAVPAAASSPASPSSVSSRSAVRFRAGTTTAASSSLRPVSSGSGSRRLRSTVRSRSRSSAGSPRLVRLASDGEDVSSAEFSAASPQSPALASEASPVFELVSSAAGSRAGSRTGSALAVTPPASRSRRGPPGGGTPASPGVPAPDPGRASSRGSQRPPEASARGSAAERQASARPPSAPASKSVAPLPPPKRKSRPAGSPPRAASPAKAEARRRRREAERVARERCETLYQKGMEDKAMKKKRAADREKELFGSVRQGLRMSQDGIAKILTTIGEHEEKKQQQSLVALRRSLREGALMRVTRPLRPLYAHASGAGGCRQHRWVDASAQLSEGSVGRLLSADGPLRGPRPASGDDGQRVAVAPMAAGSSTAELEGVPPVLLNLERREESWLLCVWIEVDGCELMVRADATAAITTRDGGAALVGGAVLHGRNQVDRTLTGRRCPNVDRGLWQDPGCSRKDRPLDNPTRQPVPPLAHEWPVGAVVHVQGAVELGRVRGHSKDNAHVVITVPVDAAAPRRVHPSKLRICSPSRAAYSLQVVGGVLREASAELPSPGSQQTVRVDPSRSVDLFDERVIRRKYNARASVERRDEQRREMREAAWREEGCTFRPRVGKEVALVEKAERLAKEAEKRMEEQRRGRIPVVASTDGIRRSMSPSPARQLPPGGSRQLATPEQEPRPRPLAKPVRLAAEQLKAHVARVKGYRLEGDGATVGDIKCRNAEWRRATAVQRIANEDALLEASKRQENPTYCAMQEWKEARSRLRR